MTDKDITAVVAQLIDAENAADTRAADRLLADDFTAITRARGVEQGRADLLDEIGKSKTPGQRRLESDPWVRQNGDLAVVRSVVTMPGESPAQLNRFRNTHVLARTGGQWKCVAWQVTKLG
jgi:ketosteroid isomerase-like protein